MEKYDIFDDKNRLIFWLNLNPQYVLEKNIYNRKIRRPNKYLIFHFQG